MGYEVLAWSLAFACVVLSFLVGMLSGQVGTVEELRDLVDKIDGEEGELEKTKMLEGSDKAAKELAKEVQKDVESK